MVTPAFDELGLLYSNVFSESYLKTIWFGVGKNNKNNKNNKE